jgi:hypothetical protein
MNTLTLQWYDGSQLKTQTIHEQQPSKHFGTIRIGRDPFRCDIILSHPTVSGLHVEIFFNPQQQSFFIRNLREQNPPLINGQRLTKGEIPLSEGSVIYLGQQELKVIAVSLSVASSVPPTILTPPQPVTPLPRPQVQGNLQHQHLPTPLKSQEIYGLQCPRCQKISSYNNLLLGCQYCGHSLQDAKSVLVPPNN